MKTFEQRVHDSNKGDIFSYDEVYRLKNIKFNSSEPTVPETELFEKQKSYLLDRVDNILKIVENQGEQTEEILTTLDENNLKLNQYTTFDQWGLSYDQNGNTTQKGTQSFTYDYRNQLISAQDLSTTVDYKYDPFGRRAEKTIDSNITKYFYSGNQVIEERDGSNQVLKQYIYGNGIDEIIRVDNYESGNSVPYYFHTNAIGSITAITDDSGNLVERVSYDTFGMPTITDYQTDPQNPTIVNNSIIGNEYLFQGRRYDTETNLYYYRARHYDPIMGRFLQTDPMGYQDSLNLYQAFNTNPLNFVDPFGRVTAWTSGRGPIPTMNLQTGNTFLDYTIMNALNSTVNLISFLFNMATGAFGYVDDQMWNAADFAASKIGIIERGDWSNDPQFRAFFDALMVQYAMAKGSQEIISKSDEIVSSIVRKIRKKGGKIKDVQGDVVVYSGAEITSLDDIPI
ncbi:RHS repeat domain-containing protein [Acidobacteriota bacterium]